MSTLGRPNTRTALDIAATTAMLAASVFLIVRLTQDRPSAGSASRGPAPVPAEPVPVSDSPTLGTAAARVVLMEFSDFQCPFCARFAGDVLSQIKAKYVDSGLVQVAFRHMPGARHRRAEPAAAAAVCAHRQGRFWPFHDKVFGSSSRLEETDFESYASEIGIDVETFRSCISSAGPEKVKQDTDLASALKLTATPTFLLGERLTDDRIRVKEVIIGARPFADFAAKIDALVASGAR